MLPFVFDGCIGGLVENAAHRAVALGRAFAAVHAAALLFARACSYPRNQILGGSEGRRLGTQLGNDLLCRIHPEPGDLGQPLDRTLMLAEQTRSLLVQLLDLWLDQLQVRQCHVHQPPVDRVEFGAGTSRNCPGVARKRLSPRVARAAGSLSPSASAFGIRRALAPSRSETKLDNLI